MKASLNKSVRDAQIRDSFNKESFISENDQFLYDCVEWLYKVQTELPRNVSKLHTLLVSTDNTSYILNFEVLRSISLSKSGIIGFDNPTVSKSDSRKLEKSVESSEEDDNSKVKEENNNDN